MKKIIILSSFFLLFFQFSFSQNLVNLKYDEAVKAYKNKNFESAVSKIKEIKPLYKTVPPKVSYLEIMAKSEVLKSDLTNDFALIEELRNLTTKYLKDNINRKNDNYTDIKYIRFELNNYPKDKATFLAIQLQKEQDELLRKKQLEKEAAEVKVREEKEAAEAKTRQEREEIIKQEQIEKDRIRNEAAAVERKKNRLIAVKADEIIAKDSEKQRRQMEREYSRRLNSFSSLGFQSGEIAKYGLLFESGGSKTIGFRMSARTSLTSEEDILNGSVIENKTEIELGPNFKLFKRFYLNIGAGYGYYDKVIRNDYAGTLTLEKTGYLVATSGVMIRISKVININGGVSFMDIDKAFYKPEITAGISFNFKRKNSY
ncbi:hypothetical protein [Flavobacterium sp. LB2P6]|uniref:hypothetical protein n=1 Tax=Flavobacterium sp. LB2P6 TaxID=3401714 RepID=UPI003AACD413